MQLSSYSDKSPIITRHIVAVSEASSTMPDLTVMPLPRGDTPEALPTVLPANFIGPYISDGRTLVDPDPVPLSSTKVRADIEALLRALMLQNVFTQ